MLRVKGLYIGLLFLILLTGCSIKSPNEMSIKESLSMNDDFLGWANIDSVSIERSQTENTTFMADISFEASDDYADYTGTATVLYNLYDGGRWMMDDFSGLTYQVKCRKRPSYTELVELCKRNIVEQAGDVAYSRRDIIAAVDYDEEYLYEAAIFDGAVNYILNSNESALSEINDLFRNMSEEYEDLKATYSAAIDEYKNYPDALSEEIDSDDWFVHWPIDETGTVLEVQVSWYENAGCLTFYRHGVLRFDYDSGEWVCDGFSNTGIEYIDLSGISGMSFGRGGYIEYANMSQVSIKWTDGNSYIYTSRSDMEEIYESLFFDSTWNHPREAITCSLTYTGSGTGIPGYGVSMSDPIEFDWINLLDLDTDAPKIDLHCTNRYKFERYSLYW